MIVGFLEMQIHLFIFRQQLCIMTGNVYGELPYNRKSKRDGLIRQKVHLKICLLPLL